MDNLMKPFEKTRNFSRFIKKIYQQLLDVIDFLIYRKPMVYRFI